MRPSRRAERFARALDGGPVTDARTARLMAVVGRLQEVQGPVVPTVAAASVLALAATSTSHAGHVAHVSLLAKVAAVLPTWTPLATGALAASVVATGMTFATSQALPGDTLYGLKDDVRGVHASLAGGGVETGRARLDEADARMADLLALERTGRLQQRASDAAVVLTAWTQDVDTATRDLLARAAAGDAQARQLVASFIGSAQAGVATVAAALPHLPAATTAGATLAAVTTALQAVPATPALPHAVVPVPASTSPTTGPSAAPTTGAATPSRGGSTTAPTTVPTTVPSAPSTAAPTTPATTGPSLVPSLPAVPGLPSLTLPR